MRLCFLIPNSDYYLKFFSDINENEQVVVFDKLLSAICKIYKKKNNTLNFLNEIFYNIILEKLSREIDFNNLDILVVTDLTQKSLPRGFIKWVKKQFPSIQMILLFYNKVSTLYGLNGDITMEELPERNIMLPFDKIFTYDSMEAKKFGFKNFVIFSNISESIAMEDKQNESIVFYCGSVGKAWKLDRYHEVDKVYKYLQSNNIKCDFRLVFDSSVPLPECEYAFTTKISYQEMIRRSIQSNVILEIVSERKSGITSRFYEALMYNKKFLTNNKTILKNHYYNEKFMKVFSDPSDIDLDWVKAKVNVDYKYQNEYTPKGFYELMEKYYS